MPKKLKYSFYYFLLMACVGCASHSKNVFPIRIAQGDLSIRSLKKIDSDVRYMPVEKVSEYKIELGKEYSDYNKTRAGSSRASGSGSGSSDHSIARAIALYFPNRILDFFDIFRADVGVGISWGGVVRVTKYAQAGYREFTPASLRVGLRGRKIPVFIEKDSEFGISPGHLGSRDRKVTSGEVGAGVDLLIVGAYLGVCFDELADFAAGIFGFDFKEDDLH